MGERTEIFVFAVLVLQIFFTELALVAAGVVKLFNLIVRKRAFIEFLAIRVFALDVLIRFEVRSPPILRIVVVQANFLIVIVCII
jgi:hypothetical protein